METGTTHWLNPNSGATNSTGFTGLPGGFLFGDYNDFGESFDDVFTSLGYEGHWWLASDVVGTDYALNFQHLFP